MKKNLGILFVFVLTVSGCASINVPNYIQDKHPYKRTFMTSFDKAYAAAIKALEDNGWTVDKESDPALFERGRFAESGGRQQTLVFTKIRQFSFFIGSRYTRLNAYLHVTADRATEVEIRYLRVTSLPFKSFDKYRNDKLADRLFKRIEENLKL